MERFGRANGEARDRELRTLTLERAVQIMEGLLSHPIQPPSRRSHHPVSLSRRMRDPDLLDARAVRLRRPQMDAAYLRTWAEWWEREGVEKIQERLENLMRAS